MSALLLLSGGMDSIGIAVWKRPFVALTVNYGQRSAAGEIRASAYVAKELGIEHRIVTCNLARYGSGDLAGTSPSPYAPVNEWWPFRNQLLISVAGVVAMSCGASEVLIGCVSTDARHVDGTQQFISSISALMSMQEGNISVAAPGLGMTTSELLREGKVPEKFIRMAFSCHTSDYACGICAGCSKALSVLLDLRDLYG